MSKDDYAFDKAQIVKELVEYIKNRASRDPKFAKALLKEFKTLNLKELYKFSKEYFDVWHKLFYPYAYPYVVEHCTKTCGQVFPDSRHKKCKECSYAKKLREHNWIF